MVGKVRSLFLRNRKGIGSKTWGLCPNWNNGIGNVEDPDFTSFNLLDVISNIHLST